jgi:hypothetical protein
MNKLLKYILIVSIVMFILFSLMEIFFILGIIFSHQIEGNFDQEGPIPVGTFPNQTFQTLGILFMYALFFITPLLVISLCIMFLIKNPDFRGYIKSLVIVIFYFIAFFIIIVLYYLFGYAPYGKVRLGGEWSGIEIFLVFIQMIITLILVVIINLVTLLILKAKKK